MRAVTLFVLVGLAITRPGLAAVLATHTVVARSARPTQPPTGTPREWPRQYRQVEQDLMMRTARAYFDVLSARALRVSVERTRVEAQARYDAASRCCGLIEDFAATHPGMTRRRNSAQALTCAGSSIPAGSPDNGNNRRGDRLPFQPPACTHKRPSDQRN